MDADHFSLLDVALLSLFSLFVWTLDRIFRSRHKAERKLEYHIYPMGGRRFYWRRSEAEKENNGSFSH